MRFTKPVLLVMVLALALTTAFAAVGVASQDKTAADRASKKPPPPSWVRADGTVDESKMPDCMPVVGSDGQPVEENGQDLCVPKEELLGKQQGPPSKDPEKIKRTNAENAAAARENIRGDSPNSNADRVDNPVIQAQQADGSVVKETVGEPANGAAPK